MSTVSPMSRQSSWRSSLRTPTSPSHYRGVQRGGFDTPLTLKEETPQLAETRFEFPRPPPPRTGARKEPTYDYKPTALRWWFLAVLVAVLLALIAVAEHSLRSLPDYGLAYDLQRLARSMSEREFPHLSRLYPRVKNSTADIAETTTIETTSQSPSKTAVLPAGQAGPAPDASTGPPTTVMASATFSTVSTSSFVSSAVASVKPSSAAVSSAVSSLPVSSSASPSTLSPLAEPEVQTGATEETTERKDPTSTTDIHETSATSEAGPVSSTSELPLIASPAPQSSVSGNGRPNSPGKAAKPTPTATSICFDCTVASSTARSAYLSIGTVTSTVGVRTTVDGEPTTVKTVITSTIARTKETSQAATSYTPMTTTIQQVTTLPGSTTVIQQVTTDSAGRVVSQVVPTVIPGSTSTSSSAVVLYPGQSWVTTARPVPTTLGSRPSLQTNTFIDDAGQTVTSTYLVTLPATTWVVTSTYGTVVGGGSRPAAPTATDTPVPAADKSVVIIMGISRSQYVIGSFLPTLLAVLLAMPLKAIDINARLFQPFVALAAAPAAGAPAEASVFLRFYGWRGTLSTFPRAFRLRQPIVVVSQLIVAGAALLAPLAAEAMRVYVPDDCTGACPGSLGVDTSAGRALQVLMALLLALLVGMGVTLVFVKTGVRQNPWSIAGTGMNKDIRDLLKGIDRGLERRVEDWEVQRALERRGYTLGGDGRESRYGVKVADFPVMPSEALLRKDKDRAAKEAKMSAVGGKTPTVPFCMLTWQGRVLLVSFFVCVLILLLYYENSWGHAGFEKFMNTQGFGVRFLLAAVGVALGLLMNLFFRSVAVISPYLLMSHRPLPAERSILITPPTNPFSGLYSAVRQRHLYLGVLSLATLLAEFLPVTLSHVPFGILETHETQLTCTYLSIAILMIMVAVVAGSLAIRWPHMPVDPRTIAGAMYYLCDSGMLGSFDGLAGLEMRDRDWMVKSMAVQYTFGTIVGLTGKERVGIESISGADGEAGV